MKLLQQSEPVPGEFEGRTYDEAIWLARQELGDEVIVRCWKMRRGGVLGFFAREAFVASITPPLGASQVKSARPMRSRKRAGQSRALRARRDEWESESLEVEPASLSGLVEGTRDEVTLGSDLAPGTAFREVLAALEAAIERADEVTSIEDAPLDLVDAFTFIEDEPLNHVDEVTFLDEPVPSDASPLVFLERGESLRESLVDIGVPPEYLPLETEDSLDALYRSLRRLPEAPPIPTKAGSVIVIVGARRDASATGLQVLAKLGLDSSDLIVFDWTSAGRQRVARRRSSKKFTVLVIEASLASRGLGEVATWIERLRPDYVLGAVSATAKRADIGIWRAQVGSMDALALRGLANTATPGELMGEWPVTLLDGAPASALRWVRVMLDALLEDR